LRVLCYSVCMKENEIQTLTERLEQIAEDMLNPCLDNQTTVLMFEMDRIRKKIAQLQK
jgi:hypothetical protein